MERVERRFRLIDSTGEIWDAFEMIEDRERQCALLKFFGFGITRRIVLADGRVLTKQPGLSYCSEDQKIYWEIPDRR